MYDVCTSLLKTKVLLKDIASYINDVHGFFQPWHKSAFILEISVIRLITLSSLPIIQEGLVQVEVNLCSCVAV